MSQSNYENMQWLSNRNYYTRREICSKLLVVLKTEKFVSLQSIDSAIDFVADLYDLSIDEVKRAMDGEEYWCV